tara:strand:+ start:86 stop:613 length:528 start_codon:yes stop_codon:yes gene_type:complete
MIDSLFSIPILNLTTSDFKRKKKAIEKVLKKYPEEEKRGLLLSNRSCTDRNLTVAFSEIFKNELDIISKLFKQNIFLKSVWSVSYRKGDFHIPHNHGSIGYAGILYLDYYPKSPPTIYIQPWNNDEDLTHFRHPEVCEGKIVIVPRFLMHFTRPNPISKPKRIVGFDFFLRRIPQ